MHSRSSTYVATIHDREVTVKIQHVLVVVLVSLVVIAGCGGDDPTVDLPHHPVPASRIGDPGPLVVTPGRTLYVPAYTGIRYYDEGRIYPLAVTLSVRNVDPERGIVLELVDFYDSSGKLVDRYLTEPIRVAPLATAEFFVPERDMRAGSSAKFLVEWNADGPVHEPFIESVMIGTSGTQGISFTAKGIPYGERIEP